MELSKNLLSHEDMPFAIERHTYHRKSTMNEVHYHDHYEILYVLENERQIVVNQQTYSLNQNTIALIAPYTPHRTIAGERTPQTRILVNFKESFIHKISTLFSADALLCFNPASAVISLDENATAVRRALIEMLKISEGGATPFGEERCSLLLFEMLLRLSAGIDSKAQDRSFFDITKYIETHFSEKITLDTISKKFFMSKFTFLRKFKAHTGVGLPAYINTIRIINAKKMLSRGERVSDVAMACGFESLSSFDRAFQKECDMSPREYKKLVMNQNQKG